MLTWYDAYQEDLARTTIGVSYKAQIPHWGEARVHSAPLYPGEMFLDCPGLDIKMHPLGQVTALDALNPAEKRLIKTLEQRGIWCLEAMAAIGSPEN